MKYRHKYTFTTAWNNCFIDATIQILYQKWLAAQSDKIPNLLKLLPDIRNLSTVPIKGFHVGNAFEWDFGFIAQYFSNADILNHRCNKSRNHLNKCYFWQIVFYFDFSGNRTIPRPNFFHVGIVCVLILIRGKSFHRRARWHFHYISNKTSLQWTPKISEATWPMTMDFLFTTLQ